MSLESVSSASTASDHDSPWEADLLELLVEIDSRVHRVMARFLGAGDRAKTDIGAMIDDAILTRAAAEDDLAGELAEVRAQIEAARASTPRRPASQAIALVEGVWTQTQSELAPVRKTVDDLHTIESTVGEILARTQSYRGMLHVRVMLLGLKSYQQAVSLAQRIKDDHYIRDVTIQSYQPGRLLIHVTGSDEAGVARRILTASETPITRLPDHADSLVFQSVD
jgi:hypothetical protein